jgi:hypothetical protein
MILRDHTIDATLIHLYRMVLLKSQHNNFNQFRFIKQLHADVEVVPSRTSRHRFDMVCPQVVAPDFTPP